jgi:DNA-directed RNA polymerase subunit RPC12/RpoP
MVGVGVQVGVLTGVKVAVGVGVNVGGPVGVGVEVRVGVGVGDAAQLGSASSPGRLFAVATVGQQLEIACSSCGATILIESLLRTARCPYCDSPSVVNRPVTIDRPDPRFAIGFTIDRRRAIEAIRGWLRGKWLAPSGLRQAAAERVQGIYLPAYLYTAGADIEYSAKVGEAYERTKVDLSSKRLRRVREIEYRDLAGRHASYVTNTVVTASRGLANAELQAIEPFDLAALVGYSPALLSGWIAEEPSLTRNDCLRLAREEVRQRAVGIIEGFLPGDTHRGTSCQTTLRDESADLILLPVWVVALRHHPRKPLVRFVVNGQTGKVWGVTPLSWLKLALIAAAIAGLAGLLVLVGRLL